MGNRFVRLASVLLHEVSLWPLVALILSLTGWHLLTEYVKWRNPGGSALPFGLPAALLLFALSVALAIAAIRRRTTATVIVSTIVSLISALGGVVYVMLCVVNR